MKLEKTSETIDLQAEQEKYERELELSQSPVAMRIAQAFGHEIKPMRYLSKGKKGIHVTVRMYEWLFNEFEVLRDSKETEFRNMSEVYRAAMYLGGLILMNMLQLKTQDPALAQRLKLRDVVEKTKFKMFVLDEIVEEIQKIYSMVERHALDRNTGLKLVDELKTLINPEDREYVSEYAKSVFRGAKPIHLFEKSTKGRPRNYTEDEV